VSNNIEREKSLKKEGKMGEWKLSKEGLERCKKEAIEKFSPKVFFQKWETGYFNKFF